MEVAFLVVILFWILPETTGNQQTQLLQLNTLISNKMKYLYDAQNFNYLYFRYGTHVLSCAGSVVLTQIHPAAPYVCRTGNITLRCQYDGVGELMTVVWFVGSHITTNPSDIPGHTALPHTTTYQEVVVDNYTNLATGYRCVPTLSNGTQPQSNSYIPQNECECHLQL